MNKRVILPAALSAACLTLAGCGGGVSTEDAFKIGRRNLLKAKTAAVTFRVAVLSGGGEWGTAHDRFGAQTDMAVDYDGFETPLPEAPITPPLGGTTTVTPPQTVLTDAVVLGQEVYAKGENVAPAGKTWARTDRTRNDSAAGTGVGLLDPMTFLNMAVKSGLTVTRPTPDKDDEDIPGTDYHLACDFSASYGESAPPCSPSDLGALGDAFPDTVGLGLDLWLDDKGRPTHLNAHADLYKAGVSTGGPLDVSMSFGGLGKPVTITAPPAGQVADR